MASPTRKKLYWEKQEGTKCGMHAANMLLGYPRITTADLDNKAKTLEVIQGFDGTFASLAPKAGGYKYSLGGNWEMDVVAEVLNDTPGVEVGTSLRKDIPPNTKDGKRLLGLLVYSPGPARHFSAVKNVSGRLYVMDSLDKEVSCT